jgi:membrane peptidoglycan carboxypeptidase
MSQGSTTIVQRRMLRIWLARRLGTTTVVAALIGVLVAVLAIPGGALAGWALDRFAVSYDNLPKVLQNPTTAQASYLYANDGTTLITTFYEENRRDVELDEVAEVARQAVVAAEDTRFYQHSGVDVQGVLRAVVANSSGDVEQGASTLTMQYVRNVLKSDPNQSAEEKAAATEISPIRKINEARYALALEQRLSKDEILRRYLNIAYFGAGSYGIHAAAHTYFAKDPSQLTLGESTLLAGLLQSPEADNPIDGNRERALQRRSYVLGSMVSSGMITAEESAAANAEPVTIQQGVTPNNCVAASSGYGFFCDYVRQWWEQQPAFGETVAERQQALRQGGYKIVTSLDPKVQAAAQEQVLSIYGYDDRFVAPMAVVEPGTGRVLSLAINRHYSLAEGVGNTVDQLVAGGPSANGYQAGSTFKMFTMLAALEAGKSLDTGFVSPSKLRTGYADGGDAGCDGSWCPVNATPSWMDGYRNMWSGFGRSVNTYFVWLEEQVGAEKAVEMAQRLGITFSNEGDRTQAANAHEWGSFTLGVSSTTPLALANAYATLAADGRYCTPLPVASVTDSTGKALPVADPTCTQAVSPDVARAATDAARCPVGQRGTFGRCDGGTAPAVSQLLGGRPVAGKTGSSTDNQTESFVAVTPQLAAAAIAANPTNPTDAVGAAVLTDVYRAVARTLNTSLQGQPVRQFTAPSTAIAYGPDGRMDVDRTPPVVPTPDPSDSPADRDRDRPAAPGDEQDATPGERGNRPRD